MPIQNLQALQIHSHEPIYWHIWYLWIWSNCFSWPKLSNWMEASNGHIHIWPLKSIKTLRKCIISFFIEVINTKLTYIFREVLENPEKAVFYQVLINNLSFSWSEQKWANPGALTLTGLPYICYWPPQGFTAQILGCKSQKLKRKNNWEFLVKICISATYATQE